MNKGLWKGVLFVSLALNVFVIGKWVLFEKWYTPTKDEAIVLAEMIQKTVESDDYKSLLSLQDEDVVAITTYVNKMKGGVYPYYMEVNVTTNKQSYYFMCKDKTCNEMELGGWGYSRYSEEEPRLPLKVMK